MIDMSMYKVVYENRVYNALAIACLDIDMTEHGNRDKIAVATMLDVFVINEDGQLISIRDEGKKFQFLPRI